MHKAESLGAIVVGEYIDAGESARSADRDELQSMLRRLSADGDVDYVIVHKVDRLARNRADDVEINLAIRKAGAKLVSVSENIDETPSGMLLHGIMSSIAEFYSQNLATEITKGMGQKAKKGGYPHRAPIGYLNAPEMVDGREIRSITLDPERADLIRWAFDAYASGDYSLITLAASLQEQGLVSRPTPRAASRPLLPKDLHNVLRNRFYVGIVKWGGVEYPGRHEPLISIETFATVQAILQGRNHASEKQVRYLHYLKGSIYCGRCGARMSFTRNKGRRGGSYDYFYCGNRHERRNDCEMPYLSVDDVEVAIEEHYSAVQLPLSQVATVRGELLVALKQQSGDTDAKAKRAEKRAAKLEAERRRLLQAHLAGAVPVDLLKEEQDRIAEQMAAVQAVLTSNRIDWAVIEKNLDLALGLVTKLQTVYVNGGSRVRRLMNQAIFDRIDVDVDGVTYARLTPPFAALLGEDLAKALAGETTNPDQVSHGRGLRENNLVEQDSQIFQQRLPILTLLLTQALDPQVSLAQPQAQFLLIFL